MTTASPALTKITPENILKWDSCGLFPEERIRAIYGDRPSMTPAEILDLDIPAEYRLWIVLRPEVLAERDLRLAVCAMAARILPIYEAQHPGDDRPRRAIETARRYALGEATQNELAAARLAVYYAAESDPNAYSVAWAAFAATMAVPSAFTATEIADAWCPTEDGAWSAALAIVRGYLKIPA